MQHQDQYFSNNPTAARMLTASAVFLFGVGLVRLMGGEYRGFVSETCYSGASLFFSRTFAQGNQHKTRDLMIFGLLMVSGQLVDTESFLPSFS